MLKQLEHIRFMVPCHATLLRQYNWRSTANEVVHSINGIDYKINIPIRPGCI